MSELKDRLLKQLETDYSENARNCLKIYEAIKKLNEGSIPIGYYPPEKRVVWEAVDKNGCGFAHSFSLRDTIRLIDEDIKLKLN